MLSGSTSSRRLDLLALETREIVIQPKVKPSSSSRLAIGRSNLEHYHSRGRDALDQAERKEPAATASFASIAMTKDMVTISLEPASSEGLVRPVLRYDETTGEPIYKE